MRTCYGLPTGTYTLYLTENELEDLVNRKELFIGRPTIRDVRCTTSRMIFNKHIGNMEMLDRKEILNDLRIYTKENVADIEAGYQPIQYFTIRVERVK